MIRDVSHSDILPGTFSLYDGLTFLFLIVVIVAGFVIVLYVLALPGKIAISRNHPHAETVRLLGYIGALPVFPWIHALIWAFHDSVTIDIRRFPRQTQEATEAEIARLKAEDAPRRKRGEVQQVPTAAPAVDVRE
jgi:Protein of unknown function (DUF3302)